MREIVTLQCTVCKRRNYTTTRNKKQQTEKIQMKKYCRFDRKHTLHKEVK
ncbi:MAG: 50S ribosomal protein L33 [Candidatus Aminicenantes bacterium]|nr:50S ribosomal protein L33 [Candidatus Aminicenantes bacterium]